MNQEQCAEQGLECRMDHDSRCEFKDQTSMTSARCTGYLVARRNGDSILTSLERPGPNSSSQLKEDTGFQCIPGGDYAVIGLLPWQLTAPIARCGVLAGVLAYGSSNRIYSGQHEGMGVLLTSEQ
jgi:hypothetical protein